MSSIITKKCPKYCEDHYYTIIYHSNKKKHKLQTIKMDNRFQ